MIFVQPYLGITEILKINEIILNTSIFTYRKILCMILNSEKIHFLKSVFLFNTNNILNFLSVLNVTHNSKYFLCPSVQKE